MWTWIEERLAPLAARACAAKARSRDRVTPNRWAPELVALSTLLLATSVQAQTCAVGETAVPLGFTGGEQTLVVPAGVQSVTVYLSGAQGGAGRSGAGTVGGSPLSPGGAGGLGGRVRGTLAVTPGEVLSVWVGGQGSQAVNAGGMGQGSDGIGGGATDLRVGGNGIGNRVAIAGGGGGGGNAGWSTSDVIAGGAGGAGGGGAGTAGANVPGGVGPFGGGGGALGSGGAGGGGCGSFSATAGNAINGDGGDSFNFSGSFAGAGYGGGGGGGAQIGGGGGGAGVGTTGCQQNWNGGGGGGAGGSSSAVGMTAVAITNGIQAGNGAALVCFTAATHSVGGTASGNQGSVTLQLDATNPASTQQVTVAAGQTSFAFASRLPAGANWNVSILSEPAGHTCNVAPDSGTAIAADITDVALNCTVSQAIANFIATPANPVYSPNGTFALSATGGASGNPVVFGSNTPSVCTVSGNTVTMLSGGTCTLTADQAAGAGYSAAPQVTLDVAIGAAAQAISAFIATPANPTFVQNGSFAVSATGGGSGNPVVFASASPAVCTVSGNTVTMLSGGTCNLTADQAGNASYTAAPQATLAVAIGTAAQAISNFTATPSAPTFSPNGTFTVSATGGASGNPVVFGSNTPSICTVAASTVTMLSAGTCALTADQAGNASYAVAPQATLAVTIGIAAQAITDFTATPANPVFAPNGTFAVSATGGASGNPVVFGSGTPSVCAVSGNTATILAAGACALTADQAGNASYAAAPQLSLNVTIAAATPVITWAGPLQRTVGEGSFELPVPTSTSGGAFTYASSNPAVATVSGRTVTLVGNGVTTLTATQAASGNYTAAAVSTTLTVAARPDPTRDRSVVDGVQAQVDASVRFATAQQSNIRDRLRQLRAAEGANASHNGLTLNLAGASGKSLSLPRASNALSGPRVLDGWGVWAAGSITLGERDGDSRADGFEFRSDGVSVGFDRRVGERALLGLAGGFGWNGTDFAEDRSNLDADQRSLAAYGLWRAGEHVYLDGLLGWGRLEFDIARWSDVAGATATAKREGDQGFASLSLGYEHRADKATMTGYGRIDASRTTLDAYRETGLGIYDLSYREQTVESSSLAAGIEGGYSGMVGTRAFRPFWSVEYRNALRNDGDAGINYVVQPVASDYLLGMRSFNEDTFVFGGGFDIELSAGWQLSLLYRHEEAGAVDSNSFALRVMFGGGPTAPAVRTAAPAP